MIDTNIQDVIGVKKPEDLERKYNLSEIQKTVELNKNELVKLDIAQKSLLDSILSSLKGFNTFGDVELWFYSGIPTTSNQPYTDWETPDTHNGDLYYDKDSGKVYQFINEWIEQTDKNLIYAMAITNAEIDVTDNHRKAFLETPTTPYDNGDWYIKDDLLYICQISKTESESYDENDFVFNSQYTKGTIANRVGDTLKVLAGVVTTIKQAADQFSIDISNIYDNGVDKVTTSTGFLFNETGLNISKTDSPISTIITENGVYIKLNGLDALTLNNLGLKIKNGDIEGGSLTSTDANGKLVIDNGQIIYFQNGQGWTPLVLNSSNLHLQNVDYACNLSPQTLNIDEIYVNKIYLNNGQVLG